MAAGFHVMYATVENNYKQFFHGSETDLNDLLSMGIDFSLQGRR